MGACPWACKFHKTKEMNAFWKKTLIALIIFGIGCVISLIGIPRFMSWYIDRQFDLWLLPIVGLFLLLFGPGLIFLAAAINNSEVLQNE